ncbi:MAG: hypothetical protein HY744_29015 [Deltaproteobacteria bacterium]|nr:hypothetical protein [Deltaproteobacteria bacterium]
MRTATVTLSLLVLAGLVATAGCKKKEEPAAGAQPQPTSAPAEVSIAECDKYVAALEACVKKLPEAARAPMQDQLTRQREAWAAASPLQRQQMAPGCQLGNAALRQNPACQ